MKRLKYFLALFLLFNIFLLASCSSPPNDEDSNTVFVSKTQFTSSSTTKAPPQETTALTTVDTTAATTVATTTASTTQTTEKTTTQTTKQTTQKTSKVTATEPVTDTPPETTQDNESITVYVTSTGEKYHRAGCRHLIKSCIEMPLSEAKLKYQPCSVCKPPS